MWHVILGFSALFEGIVGAVCCAAVIYVPIFFIDQAEKVEAKRERIRIDNKYAVLENHIINERMKQLDV